MALATGDLEFGLMPNHPVQYGQSVDVWEGSHGCVYRGKVYSDNASSVQENIVIYFHGSGAGVLSPGPMVDTLTQRGSYLYGVNALGYGISGPAPFRYGYGNVNNPEFTIRWIKDAWWVHNTLSKLGVYGLPWDQGVNIVLIGHSMGAAGVLAYLAGYAEHQAADAMGPNFKGAIVNGATIAGLGDGSWNDVNQNINCMSQMMRLAQQAPGKRLITYSDNDVYAPPDYVKRVQMGLDPNDGNTYLLSAGERGHSWFNSSVENASALADWVDQLRVGAAIKNIDGTLAVPGVYV